MKLSILAQKRADSLWHFDHEHHNTKEELLCNGTELVLDHFFTLRSGREAFPGDILRIDLNTEYVEICDTVLKFQFTDEYGTVYIDNLTQMKVWLCPWLQGYFGYKPDRIWITTGWGFSMMTK